MDWDASYGKNLHAVASVRWLILQHVTNKQWLKLIIDQHDKRLDELCSKNAENVYPYLKIPMIKKSFYQLIKDKRKEIKSSIKIIARHNIEKEQLWAKIKAFKSKNLKALVFIFY